jgi:hypothetical protein
LKDSTLRTLWFLSWIVQFALILLVILELIDPKPPFKDAPLEPPTLKLSDYPKTEEHCKICSQCKARWDLIEKKQITWDSPACCSEGFEIGMQEFKEKLKKEKN